MLKANSQLKPNLTTVLALHIAQYQSVFGYYHATRKKQQICRFSKIDISRFN